MGFSLNEQDSSLVGAGKPKETLKCPAEENANCGK
jgi:hypothetical protein